MPRRLALLNLVLLVASFAAGVYIVRALTEPAPRPVAVRPRPPAEAPKAAEPDAAARPPAAAYGVVASRNLFSPTRSETPVAPVATRPAAALPKPNLFGVVLAEGSPIAYLEDPATKRVAGYHLGDSIAGGTVKSINADSVVLARPEGPVDVRLHDPARPRPVVQAPPQGGTPQVPGQPPVIPGTAQPTVRPTPQPTAGVPYPQGVQQPGVQPGSVPPMPGIPPRRPLPPTLLRRVAPGSPSDGSQQ